MAGCKIPVLRPVPFVRGGRVEGAGPLQPVEAVLRPALDGLRRPAVVEFGAVVAALVEPVGFRALGPVVVGPAVADGSGAVLTAFPGRVVVGAGRLPARSCPLRSSRNDTGQTGGPLSSPRTPAGRAEALCGRGGPPEGPDRLVAPSGTTPGGRRPAKCHGRSYLYQRPQLGTHGKTVSSCRRPREGGGPSPDLPACFGGANGALPWASAP